MVTRHIAKTVRMYTIGEREGVKERKRSKIKKRVVSVLL